MNKEKVAPALGKISSGLYIATSVWEDSPVGMLCSFVEQCSFEPPMLTVAMQPGRIVQMAMEESRLLGINVIAEGDNGLMKAFSTASEDSPFDDLTLVRNEFRIPQLLDAMAFLACKVIGKLETGDHWVYSVEVIDGELQFPDGVPKVRVRKNGFHY